MIVSLPAILAVLQVASATPAPAAVREHSYAVLLRRIDHFVDRSRRAAIIARLNAERSAILAHQDDAGFVSAINTVLRETSNDRHLQVVIEDGKAAPSEDDAGDYDIAQVSMRADGVGYLRLTGFSGKPASIAAIDAAAARLATARALILDLRDNGGGGEVSFARLLGQLFPVRTELNGIAWRTCVPRAGLRPDACEQGPMRIERRFTDTPATPALAQMPVYVLVSPRTFSAAEAVAYELQQRGRAMIVGEPTGGGGSPSAAMDLESKFAVIMPIGRLHPITRGAGWEGVGVKPDVIVDTGSAEDAVTRMIAGHSGRHRRY